MSLKEKLEKIKKAGIKKSFELPENEKTGVVNGLLILGAAIGTLISQQQTAHSTPTPTSCTDTVNDKVTETEIPANNLDLGFVENSWQDHCWWDHCWWDHWDHWDFDQFSETAPAGP